MIFTAIMLWVYRFGLRKIANRFQTRTIPKWERIYEKILRGALKGYMPYVLTIGTIILLIISFSGFGYSIGTQRTKIEFFPDNTPNQIIVYVEYPQGTDIEKTNIIAAYIFNDTSNIGKDLKNNYNLIQQNGNLELYENKTFGPLRCRDSRY